MSMLMFSENAEVIEGHQELDPHPSLVESSWQMPRLWADGPSAWSYRGLTDA